MELLCIETFTPDSQLAKLDPVIFKDMRVIKNLLMMESAYVPKCNYFLQIQDDLEPLMRKTIAGWMMEVCEDQHCEDQVFPLAINFLDRFLCACPIEKNQLQLSAAACLLIASKIRQCHALTVQILCFYTENSINCKQLKGWEVLVASKLEWEICGITGYDFIDLLLEKLPHHNIDSCRLLRNHSQTLLALAYTDPQLIWTRASVMGCAAIVSAARGLGMDDSIVLTLMKLTNTTLEKIEPVVTSIEMVITAESAAYHQSLQQGQPETPKSVLAVHF